LVAVSEAWEVHLVAASGSVSVVLGVAVSEVDVFEAAWMPGRRNQPLT
jgi:hypothetical protein